MGFFSSIGNFFKDNVGSVLGAVGDVAGGLLGLSGTKDSNATEAALAQQQMAYQKELHQNQIQWRVEDAKKAGIHPLAALGVSSASYSPVSVSPSSPDYSFLSDMGQNLNRAIMQGKTDKERKAALDLQKTKDAIDIRKANADADYAETQAAAARFALQQQLFPSPAPTNKANGVIDGQNTPTVAGNSIKSGTSPLLSASRVGNTLLLHINPDISDALTEDVVRNHLANLTAEMQMGRIMPEIAEHFTKEEQQAVVRGEAEFRYTPPSTIRFFWKPHMRPKYSENRREVSGKIIRGRL